ncbi:PTS sugar transporter subunit IIA [Sphingomicrobium clamense]|uniref:PTS sugar transporter subunit IIA n=1 Tax=Sphingomicrobium clamense TaxID=2851013 RepID=A0ABS6V3J7_9SPHN|nr:PTS sugar transporter subunit IIA [Sphingomicrobium sp. B8]MBW0143930.1 PTS sugar transporter subunit IIA [Sphingomicrobium sp. B8]
MNLSEFIDFSSIRTKLSAASKRQLLQMLGQVASQKLGLEPGIVVDSILEREKLGSTGFGGGVAIPHGKVEGLSHVYGLVARLDEPVDFDAIDKMPVDVVFLLLSPPDAGADHLRALAAVSRLVRDAGTVEKMRGARDRDALAAVLMSADEVHAA